MRRERIEPRPDWREKVEARGLLFHTNEDRGTYWDESVRYVFTEAEIDELETATAELHRICVETVRDLVGRGDLERLGLPARLGPLIRRSLANADPSLYGRFDLVYGAGGPPKMLEYNADTPTSLLEAAVIQWWWLQDLEPDADQFNSLWEGLVETWTRFKDERRLKGTSLHFAHDGGIEDGMTITLLRDAAEEAGLVTEEILMNEIGWNDERSEFTDLSEMPLRTVFKLYPWEWMGDDKFAMALNNDRLPTQWIEPAWKAILSNKAILPVLWERYPDHPNLLPAWFEERPDTVRKPFFSREGANIRMPGAPETDGPYAGPYIYQAVADVPVFDGARPILGSWIVGDEPRGMGIRETDGPVTDDLARFVPHLFR